MQRQTTEAVQPSRRVQAAGAVTLVFGVLTACLATAWVITSGLNRASQDSPPLAQASLVILIGTLFILLGWGVLRRKRLCALLAAVFATVLLAFHLFATLVVDCEGSLYFLLVPLFVLASNWLAWQEMSPPTIADAPQP